MAELLFFAAPIVANANAVLNLHRNPYVLARLPASATATLVSLTVNISFDAAAAPGSSVEAGLLLDSSAANAANLRRSGCYAHRFASVNEPGSFSISLDLAVTPFGTELLATPTGARPPQIVIINSGVDAFYHVRLGLNAGAAAPAV